MDGGSSDTGCAPAATSVEPRPTVTVIFLAYNRREQLRYSLTKTLHELDYDEGRLDVIVVDNASTDRTNAMLDRDFPTVRVIERASNSGVSGWNDGFAAATGEYVLALDDDCHLPPDGLRIAVEEARRNGADLVSFGVRSSEEPHRFDLHEYITGLLAFWGCAVLIRGEVLERTGGYDPEIFVWGNEVDFMIRFFDHGYRHLHLPDVVAVHAKRSGRWPGPPVPFPDAPYRANKHNFAYTAARHLRPRDAAGTLVALLVDSVLDGHRLDRVAYRGVADALRGFRHGLRHRQPVQAHVSRAYRHNFETFASPWWVSRAPSVMIRDAIARRGISPDRRHEWRARRPRFYPEGRGVLELRASGASRRPAPALQPAAPAEVGERAHE